MNNLTKEKNNFNLVRLFACLQILVLHTYNFYEVGEGSLFLKTLWLFPGVIIFFTISGFLIAKSLEHSTSRSFTLKRFFRIYPALIINVAVTCVLLFYFGSAKLNTDFFKYLVTQLSIFQFYTPESMKGFAGGHHPNGALWTISVELQFYIFFFVLAKCLKWKQKSIRFKNNVILYLVAISCLINYFSNQNLNSESTTFKLLFNSIFYHFYFFGIGILFWINFSSIKRLFINKANYWLAGLMLVIILIVINDISISRYQYNNTSFLYLVLLIFSVFSFVFSYNGLSFRLLKNVDISYGTYIYHVLVINTFLQLHISKSYFFMIYGSSILLGIISWFAIEKRLLVKAKSIACT